MSDWDEYLAALRRLDAIRTANDAALRSHDENRRSTDTAMDALWTRLSTQRQTLTVLADQCRLPPPPTHPPPVETPPNPGAAVARATELVDGADRLCGDARYLAHRPKLFPRWRTDERNGLIYGLWALLSLLAQVGILAASAGTGSFSDMIGVFAICALLPFLALAAGWLSIGVVSRPVLGEPITGPGGRLERNPRLGLVICASTFLVSCWLGNLYLT